MEQLLFCKDCGAKMHIRIDYRNGGKRHVAFCSEYHKGKAKNSLKFGTTKNGAALYAEKELHLKQDLRRILSPKTTGSGLLLWYIPGVIEICMSRTT